MDMQDRIKLEPGFKQTPTRHLKLALFESGLLEFRINYMHKSMTWIFLAQAMLLTSSIPPIHLFQFSITR